MLSSPIKLVMLFSEIQEEDNLISLASKANRQFKRRICLYYILQYSDDCVHLLCVLFLLCLSFNSDQLAVRCIK